MKKIAKILFYAGVGAAILASCQKELPHQKVTNICKPAEVSISVEGADGIIGLMAPKTKTYNIHVKAESIADQLMTVSIAPNPDKVAAYNAANNTAYDMVPGDAYEISKNTFYIPRYNTEGTSSTVTIKANGLPDDEKVRVLPITITKVETTDEVTVKDSTVYITVYRISTSNIRFEKGTGTAADPFLVEVANDMFAMNNDLKEGEPTYIKMTADIDMSQLGEWMPVNAIENPKTIHFDGNGKTIKKMFSNATVKPSLFGTLVGSIKNVTFEDCTIESGVDATGVGLIAGNAKNATFENVTVKGLTINSAGSDKNGANIGGLVGIAEDCVFKKNTIEVNIPDHNDDGKNPRIVGGMIGALKGTTNTVENCHTKGAIFAHHYVGGFIGGIATYDQVISNCSAEVNLTTVGNYGGILLGYASKGLQVIGCSAKGKHISNAQLNYKGGFMGACQGGMTAKKCSFEGEYENHSGTHIGAFIGNPYRADASWNDGVAVPNSTFEDCYASGKLTVSAGASGKGRMQGGFIGVIEKAHGVTINRCYSSVDMSVKGANGAVGGLVGIAVETSTNLDVSIEFTMTNCIAWNSVIDNEAPGISGGYGVGAFCGAVAKKSTLANNYRRADMNLIEVKAEGTYSLTDHASADDLTPAGARCPYHGVAAPAGATCSQVAKTLGWPEDIWDLSGEMPKLK